MGVHLKKNELFEEYMGRIQRNEGNGEGDGGIGDGRNLIQVVDVDSF